MKKDWGKNKCDSANDHSPQYIDQQQKNQSLPGNKAVRTKCTDRSET